MNWLKIELRRLGCVLSGHEYVTVDAAAGHHVCAHCGKIVFGFCGWL